jgi:uncharacterized protein YceH (UPF0502 family)
MMSEVPGNPQSSTGGSPRWQALGAIDRRVLGVLAEKAKTTPDTYPMSLNAVCTGCNQKSNRDPLMQLEPDDVEESLDRLRQLGAVGLIEGYGRVNKYRHYLYDWLGVDKVELAVMTELLLRGDQTIGELRGRASRMEPIADLDALRHILDSLKAKKLVISLTPEGRGHVVSHGLYKPREQEALHAKYAGAAVPVEDEDRPAPPPMGGAFTPSSKTPLPSAIPAAGSSPTAASISPLNRNAAAPAHNELASLRAQMNELQHSVEELQTELHQLSGELRSLKDALGA